MKLSSRARYGLKAMCFIAEHSNEDTISLNVISDGIGVSEKYLEQLIATLKKADLVVAVRGVNGGYKLSRDAEDISCGEIIRALEDGLEIIECITGECSKCASHSPECDCTTHNVWNKLYKAINGCLDSMSLASVVAGE